MSAPLRVLVVTDSFPPVCGGSGWSTWTLSRGLLARGHQVEVVKVDARAAASGTFERQYEGVPFTHFCRQTTNVPLARNIASNERLWRTLERYLDERLARLPVDIIHAQHVLSTVPAIRAGARATSRSWRPCATTGRSATGRT